MHKIANKAVENLAKNLSFLLLAPCKSVVRSYYQNEINMLYFNQIVEIEDIPGRLVYKGENNVSLKFYSKNANAEIEIEKDTFSKCRVTQVWEEVKYGKSKIKRLARAY
jgi:hypothetical protein